MAIKTYSFEEGGLKRLEISMDGMYNYTIKFDGNVVGQIKSKKSIFDTGETHMDQLARGKEFTLSDNSVIRLVSANPNYLNHLVVYRDGKPLPECKSIKPPLTKKESGKSNMIWGAILFVIGLILTTNTSYVFWGAMIVGAYLFIKGLINYNQE